MKTMAKRSNTLLDDDDDIMLFQILPRLPARSLGRCKCVCKQWRSFLTTPVFTKMHLHHVNIQNHRKQLIFPTTCPWVYFRIIDYKTPEVGLSYRSLPFKANCNRMSIVASLNGLVCVGIDPWQLRSGRYLDIVLWNPLTGDYKTLSKDNSHDNCFTIPARGYGLYYSSCEDDYKLLRITQSTNAYIYSLKSDSWRQVESASCLFKYWYSRCFLYENLYFLVRSRNNMNIWSYSIIRFDTKAEKFTEIMTPPSIDNVATGLFKLSVVSGRIYLGVAPKGVNCSVKLDLWKMDEDGEWTNPVSVNRAELDLNHFMTRIKKVCTSSNMEILEGGNFVETIVSLNR